MPKAKGKSNAEYWAMYKALRRVTDFGFSAGGKGRKREAYKSRGEMVKTEKGFEQERKEKFRPVFTRSEKSAITRAAKELKPYKTARPVFVRKLKRETKKDYRARVKRLKKELGQEAVRGNRVFLRVPERARVSLKKGRVEIKGGTKEGTLFREVFEPVDAMAFARSPYQYLDEVKERLENFGDFGTVAPVFQGGYRGRGFDIGTFNEIEEYLGVADLQPDMSGDDEDEEPEHPSGSNPSLLLEAFVYRGFPKANLKESHR